MCTVPPAPPPPPPPILPGKHTTPKPPKPESLSCDNSDLDICNWASENTELQEACVKRRLCIFQEPFRYKYTKFEPILQVGPTCGLVALSMLVKGKVPAADILNISKQEGFSHNGEMFSCKNMAKLAEKVLSLASLDNVEYSVENCGLYCQETIRKLLDGALLLVPYDADFNHSPSLRNGHTAHWALICGVMIVEDPGKSYLSKSHNVYVFGRHGKSKYLAIWDLEELDKSNKNLWEFSPRRGDDGGIYILPEGGISGENGLREQYLVFEGL